VVHAFFKKQSVLPEVHFAKVKMLFLHVPIYFFLPHERRLLLAQCGTLCRKCLVIFTVLEMQFVL